MDLRSNTEDKGGLQRTWNVSFRFDVVPILGEEVFPYRRFLLEQNNVRGIVGGDSQLLPTPRTNLIILRDITLATNAAFIDKTIDASSSVVETLILIKVNRAEEGK